jgi:Zn-dependent metalloprotease
MSHQPFACILSPDLLHKLARESTDEQHRLTILQTLELDQSFRLRRAEVAARQIARPAGAMVVGAGGTPNRSIFDQAHSTAYTPGTLVRKEGQGPVSDVSINQAYDGFGLTYKLYWDIFHRDSIDDQGMPIEGLVHYGDAYDNAFWDGAGHMFFGDGDGQLLTDTTKGLDVIGHELTHGVT